jgi:hypothetical protein
MSKESRSKEKKIWKTYLTCLFEYLIGVEHRSKKYRDKGKNVIFLHLPDMCRQWRIHL